MGSSLGAKASSSIVALADSSKHMIQIMQLLEERKMSFSFCLNKDELLLLSGFGLLFQGLDLNRKGKLMQDRQRLVCSVIAVLERNAALGSAAFKSVACAMISVDRCPPSIQAVKVKSTLSARRQSDSNMRAPQSKSKASRKPQPQAMTSRFSTGDINTVKRAGSGERRATVPAMSTDSSQVGRSKSQNRGSSAIFGPIPPQAYEASGENDAASGCNGFHVPNLDYLSFGNDNDPIPTYPNVSSTNSSKEFLTDEFAGLLNSPVLQEPFDSLFSSSDLLGPYMTPPPSTANFEWGADGWRMPADLNIPMAGQSVGSLTEEEVTSGEGLSVSQ